MKKDILKSLILIGLLMNQMECSAEKELYVSPNIVLILVDDIGYGDFACYGNDYHKTPNIDKLASEGMLFTDFHTNGVVSSPTRAAILTGRYQQYSGVEGVITAKNHRDYGLPSGAITIAKLLNNSGYKTGIFGKWHLGYETKYNPINYGFDKFVGYVSGNVDYFSHIDSQGYEDWWLNDKLKPEEGYTTNIITNHAIKFIRENKENPFFLYVPYEACHTPLQGPDDGTLRSIGTKKGNSKTISNKTNRQIYREMIESLDYNVGRLMSALKNESLDNNTLILFLSDNGGSKYSTNKPFSGKKGSLLEGGHRVPFIARWLNKIPSGKTIDVFTCSFDLFPTICELAKVDYNNTNTDGCSLVNIFRKENLLSERTVYWRTDKEISVRRGYWKLIVSRNYDNVRLYNLKKDIEEKNNLSQNNEVLVQEFIALIKKWESNFNKIKQFS